MLKISIVSPSYNQRKFLEDCLRSVKEQSYASLEHIVMDGGSTDGSVELLLEYSAKPGWSHLRWVSERDGGQSDALNKGFQSATGDVIGWLNSDDFYLPGCFEAVARTFREYPKTDILYGDYFWINSCGHPIQLRREITFSRLVLFHGHMNFIHSSGALFLSRRVIDNGHYLSDEYHYAMDYEFYLRLAGAGYCFRHLSKAMSAFRWHEQSKSGTHSAKQLAEYENARWENLTRLGQLKGFGGSRFGLALLRWLADGRRWGEKALRGYYFSQFRPVLEGKSEVD